MAMAMADGDERLRNKEQRISEYGANEDDREESGSLSLYLLEEDREGGEAIDRNERSHV